MTANASFGKSVKQVQNDMNALSDWCVLNGIRMNIDKTKIMVFGSPVKVRQLPEFEIEIEGRPLSVVTSYKYLGVTLDSQLNYNKHVQNTIGRVSQKLKQLRCMRYFLDVRAATLVYKNMILPIMEYGDIFLVGTTVENRKKLQTLQNKSLRCALLSDQDESVNELHKRARLQKLKIRREQHLLSHMYDLAIAGKHVKKPKSVGVKTRSQNKRMLKLGKPNTEKYKKSLAYAGPQKWNALPEQYHHVKSRSLFNNRIKRLVEK